ncbi:AT-hook motif nuclear-localized protein 29-like [Apium graveolens]|uniref:AT-hook motif nuclear-localized protein 29-like n=1 Tax=Apium graveolens TaxID=4045 RepID=UPI003D7A600A
MEGDNNQSQDSSQMVQRLLPPHEPHHSDFETNPLNNTNPQNNNSTGGGGFFPKSCPRGRLRGSKNKPKTPVVRNCESFNVLEAHVLEISSGADIMETLNTYAIQRGRGVCIFNGKGTVWNVIIHQHASSSLSGGVITLPDAFEIISITGTVLPPPAPPGFGSLSIFLSGGQGQVLGGKVVGPLIAKGAVILMVATFANAVFERIPLERHGAAERENAANGANQVQEVQPLISQAFTVIGSVGTSLSLFNAGPAVDLPNNFVAPGPPF